MGLFTLLARGQGGGSVVPLLLSTSYLGFFMFYLITKCFVLFFKKRGQEKKLNYK